MKTLNAVVLAAALFLTATAAAAHPAVLAAALRLAPTPAHVGALSESAAPEQGRRRRPGRPERRREQPAEPAPAPARTTPAPAQTTPAPAQTTPPARPLGLCDIDWHQSARGSTVTRAIAGGADVNQACGSGSSPLLLALEVGRADVVLALIRAGASLDYRDPYEGLTPNQVINDQCDAGRLDRRVCDEVRRGFEARAEAHNNLCDPRWWRSFYRQSQAEVKSRMQAVMRTPGLDVNYDCGRGDRPLHIALQDSLTPLTDGAYWAIGTFMYEADNLDLFARNRSGRSPMDLAEVRYDHQIRGNYRRLLSRFCNNQITGEEYNRQYDDLFNYEVSVYVYIKGYESAQAYQAAKVAFNQEIFGTTQTGGKTRDQLCLKHR